MVFVIFVGTGDLQFLVSYQYCDHWVEEVARHVCVHFFLFFIQKEGMLIIEVITSLAYVNNF
jgi:hypothetical protein